MKNKRMTYLVINNKINEINLYTDKRKVKALMNIYDNLDIYIFKGISSKEWDEEHVYKLNSNGTESKIEILTADSYYTDLGCFIMESLAKAKWNSSIKYPDNGWHICSICGKIINDINKCLFCEEFVCWNCSYDVDWTDGNFCSYECYRNYLEENHDIPYNPEEEYKEKLCKYLKDVLEYFEQKQLLNILIEIKSNIHNEKELKDIKANCEGMNEEELLNIIIDEDEDSICDVLLALYENETDDYLSIFLDGEAYINSLDPNDPADAWFFED